MKLNEIFKEENKAIQEGSSPEEEVALTLAPIVRDFVKKRVNKVVKQINKI